MKRATWIAAAFVFIMVGMTAALDVTINGSVMVYGYMNVFETNGTTYLWGSGWCVADLCAYTNDGKSVNFTPYTINDPDPYWYIGGGGPGAEGNKVMEANWYADPPAGTYNGQTIVFSGDVVSNTLVSGYSFQAFIKDFAADWSSFVASTVDLTPTNAGTFKISLATINDPARHVQWGLQMKGRNVWSTDVATKGLVTVREIPEPVTLALGGIAMLAMVTRRRS
jgi:hypothetical protein